MDRISYCSSKIRTVPDFPKPGIAFKDITPMIADARALQIVLDEVTELFIDDRVEQIVGIEARGFIFGGALAARLGAGFIPARKPGKLPAEADAVSYDTEYSTASLEIHKGSFAKGARVLVVDDVLATGGTAKAAADLVELGGARVVGFAFIIELGFLGGRAKLPPAKVESVLRY